VLKDFNRDGILDFANSNFGPDTWGISLGNGNGTFKPYQSYVTGGDPSAIQSADIDEDGYYDVVIGENTSQGVRVFFGNGDGSFKGGIFTSNGSWSEDLELVDVNGDGALDVLSSNFTSGGFSSMISATQNVSTVRYLDLLSQSNARQALITGKQRLTRITSELGAIGSYESRIQSSLNNIRITVENFAAAESQILDTDVAQEAANLAKGRILQQAAASVLAQANQEPQIALKLLQAN
jgi:flagellin-like hook-associated protein FlgL